MIANQSLWVVYGHHKCATGWITANIREMCFHLGLRHHIVHLPKHYAAYGDLGAFVRARSTDVLFYTNATLEQAHTLPPHRGLHVVRDPRDVLVSAYFSHLHSHPTEDWNALEPHRQALQSASKEEGLLLEMDFSRQQFDDMTAWNYDQEHILELQMETLTGSPVQEFARVADFFSWLDEREPVGVEGTLQVMQLRLNRLNQKGRRFMPGNVPMFPVPQRRLQTMPRSEMARIVRANSFENLSGGRSRGEENTRSHYRKGTPGDWKNHFTPAITQRFKERHGDLLLKLGYESDPHW